MAMFRSVVVGKRYGHFLLIRISSGEAGCTKRALLAHVSGPLFCPNDLVDGLFQLPKRLWSTGVTVVMLNTVCGSLHMYLRDDCRRVSAEPARAILFCIFI